MRDSFGARLEGFTLCLFLRQDCLLQSSQGRRHVLWQQDALAGMRLRGGLADDAQQLPGIGRQHDDVGGLAGLETVQHGLVTLNDGQPHFAPASHKLPTLFTDMPNSALPGLEIWGIGLLLAATVGAFLGAWLVRRSNAAHVQAAVLSARARSDADLAVARDRAQRVPELEAALRQTEQEVARWQSQVADLNARMESERSQSQEKLALLQQARDTLTLQFKTLANEILEEKGQRFAQQHQQQLGQILEPLRVKLGEFQGKVEQLYDTEGKERSALAQQVHQLLQLNRTLSDDAKNLTQALKGSVKSQGNWGELILARVLEASGLRQGEEYVLQESHVRDDGTRAQPDVVVRLPQGRHLIIDAKVSLVAYDDYCRADEEAQRVQALKRHLDSLRAHIRGLSQRNYQDLHGAQSPDFVLMFVAIEPAFMLGVSQDEQLFMEAWNRNVLLVSPSTLLFVVRTVAHLWQQEAQSRNAQDIARRGAELYDRLCGFVSELEKVGERLNQAQDSYREAWGKLSTNKGNVIRQAQMLKELGVKPNKSLPTALVELSSDAPRE